jgi:general secretion pathway protein G
VPLNSSAVLAFSHANTMAMPLPYAPRTARRGAPWWLWTLAALFVLGGFAWFCVPFKVSGRTEAARRSAARADVQQLRVALDAFKVDTGRYPSTAEGLGALVDPPPDRAGWHGPFVRRLPNDPWGRPYVYVPVTEPFPPKVLSLGPDGRQGTADDVASR